MKHLRRVLKVFALMALVLTFIVTYFAANNFPVKQVKAESPVAVQKAETPLRDKETNTANIVEKDAWWTDPAAYKANLMLKVNGSSLSGPMDVIFVLDRSGSMDMTYTDNANSEGYPLYSSPCLNQEHFYLEPLGQTKEPVENADVTKVYNNADNTLTVYNPDVKQWEQVGTTPVHLFEQFTPDTAKYIPYHFKKEGDTFVRISHWDATAQVGNKATPGVWVHGEEDEGCYDRWMLSKKAITTVSTKLFKEHPENRVALVPFSIRDSSMVEHLNYNSARMNNFRDNLISKNAEKGHFDTTTGTGIDAGGAITGTYNSIVGWENNIVDNEAALEDMLPRLFTTPQTDYQYGLSMAYNLLQERSDEAKSSKGAMVVFLSDGVPQSASTMRLGWGGGGSIVSFAQADARILSMSDAITNNQPVAIEGALTGLYQRHDINPTYLTPLEGGTYEASGMGAEMITVDYMANSAILKSMTNDPQNYFEVPADNIGAGEEYLSNLLLNSTLFPGGRYSELRDKVSQYYYVPEDATLPEGITVEGDYETKGEEQTIVWDLGDLYHYAPEDYPEINIPLVLKEEYRQVARDTYYPTNADTSEKGTDIYDVERGIDDEDTGAKLYYTDPTQQKRYDTIGTPKLAVHPTVKRSVNYQLIATKALEGRSLKANEFQFELLDASGKVIQTATNDGSGQIVFNEQSYTATGKYQYTIREKNGADQNIEYDPSTYPVVVEVKEESGQLIASATGEDKARFENKYHPQVAKLRLEATKELVGKKLSDDAFTFELLDASGKVIQTTKNKQSGAVLFEEILYNQVGAYDYIIREQKGEDPQITYDPSNYKVHVNVEDHDGQLVAVAAYDKKPHFKNRYQPLKAAEASATKTKKATTPSKSAPTKLSSSKATSKVTLPQTGDSMTIWIILMGLGILLGVYLIYAVVKALRTK